MSSQPMSLENRHAIVTGAGRGIGRAIAGRLAQAGARVAVVDIDQSTADEAARAIGKGAVALKVDVSRSDEVDSMASTLLERWGQINILVNNAGITRDQLFVRMKPSGWQEVLDVNLTGAFHCARSVAKPMMKQREGCIINISSVAGVAGNPGQANYAASKAGLIGLTKSLAKELAAWKIRVNAVAPGYISTEMTLQLPDKVKEEVRGLIPLDRFGAPEDVAWAVFFLASPAADYITGQVLNVNGGLYI